MTSLKTLLNLAPSERAAEQLNQRMAQDAEAFQLQRTPPPGQEEGEILVATADGGDEQRLTDSPYQDIRPRFSPDGRQIAFTSHRDGNAEIYVMNADGSRHRPRHRPPRARDYADWHPDGQRLVIVSERDGKQDLYLVPL